MPRSVLKTVSYSAMHFCVAFAVAFALTGSWAAAMAIGLVEPFVQTGAYALHERLWEGGFTRGGEVSCRAVQNLQTV